MKMKLKVKLNFLALSHLLCFVSVFWIHVKCIYATSFTSAGFDVCKCIPLCTMIVSVYPLEIFLAILISLRSSRSTKAR